MSDPQHLCYCAGEAVCPEIAAGQRCREEVSPDTSLVDPSEAREAAFSKLATAAHAAYGLLEEFGIGTAEGRVAEALRQAFKAVEDASK